jgi:hypothetical protein
MTMWVGTTQGPGHLDGETRSLLRAMLLGAIVQQRVSTGADDGHAAVRAAEHAIARLDAGTYGSCDACAVAVPLQRLLESPTAQWCERCDVRARSGRRGQNDDLRRAALPE